MQVLVLMLLLLPQNIRRRNCTRRRPTHQGTPSSTPSRAEVLVGLPLLPKFKSGQGQDFTPLRYVSNYYNLWIIQKRIWRLTDI